MMRFVAMATAACALAACGDAPQVGKVRKADVSAFQGSDTAAYTTPGWKTGDAVSWEAQLKSRAQFGQNEYTRSAP
jgi:hypothetical protein